MNFAGYDIKALALDLDGTLTNEKKEITARTKQAVSRAIDSGIAIILASGRPVLGIRAVAEALDLYSKGGYILAYNGGEIIDCKRNSVIFSQTLPIELYSDIVRVGREFGVHALTYDKKGVIAESADAPYVIKEAFNNGIEITTVEDLSLVLSDPVVKFMIVGDPIKISNALDYLKRKFSGKANVFLSEPYFMEITAIGIEKAKALTRMIEHLKIDQTQLAACGDGLNDLSMLEYAGLSVAMANAYEQVKLAADYITLSNKDDGVADFIEKLLTERK